MLNNEDIKAVILGATDDQLVSALVHRAKVSSRPLKDGGVKVTLRLNPTKAPKEVPILKRRYRRRADPYGLMPNSR